MGSSFRVSAHVGMLHQSDANDLKETRRNDDEPARNICDV
jgi:hypothetical protein